MKMEMTIIYASMAGCILPLSRAGKADVVLHYIQLELFSAISWIVAAERCLFLVGLYSNNFLQPRKQTALYIQQHINSGLFLLGYIAFFAYRVKSFWRGGEKLSPTKLLITQLGIQKKKCEKNGGC